MKLKAQDTLTLLFSGDIMGHETQINAARRSDGFEYDTTFSYVQPLIQSHDIAVANLELTLGIQPYKGYPQFSSPPELAVSLKKAGFDLLTTTNNHSCDQGERGVQNTIKVLDTVGINHTGTFTSPQSKAANYPFTYRQKKFKLGFLSFTYGTNTLTVSPPSIVNYLDSQKTVQKDLEISREREYDHLIALPHWGKQYENLPSNYQKKHAQILHEGGVQSVIGSHPHVVQPIINDSSKQQLTAYSLGNYVSNQRTAPRDGGMMLRLELTKNKDEVKIARVSYILTWVYTPRIKGQKYFFILPASYFEDKPDFFNRKSAYDKMLRYLNHARPLLYKHNINASEYRWNDKLQKWTYEAEIIDELSNLLRLFNLFF